MGTANIAEALKPLATPIADLSPLPGNPRKGDVEAVKRSYERFGQRKPIVANRDGTVIAGNHQLKAAQALGWDEIAVVFVDDDDQTAKAFALADNRTADLGTYDDQALADLLAEVAVDPELLLATGYSLDDLALIVGDVDDADWGDALGALPSGDKQPFQQMTFTLHDDQAVVVRDAISAAVALGDYADSPNENRNGNALARICETFVTKIGPT
jgi:ParB-like chromosome segregation protein Spo0J